MMLFIWVILGIVNQFNIECGAQESVWDDLIQMEPQIYSKEVNTNSDNSEEFHPRTLASQAGLLVHTQNGVGFCGGSLISSNYVLTAAHCVEAASLVTVILGADKIQEKEFSQIRLNATKIKIHEQYSNLTLQNDIALIKLPKPVQTNDNVKFASLPYWKDIITNQTFDDETCIVSGWTRIGNPPSVSNHLRYIESPVLKPSVCEAQYPGIIKKYHICINPQIGRNGCIGDAGGPLVIKFDLTQVGILSFGLQYGCEIRKPIVYTRVTDYLYWIDKNSDAEIEYSENLPKKKKL